MTNELREKLNQEHEKTMLDIDINLETLNSHKDSKMVLDKIMNMTSNFLYNNFNQIIPGFTTAQDTKDSLHTLVNILLDDTELFYSKEITNQDLLDRIKDTKVLKDRIKPIYKETLNTSGKGTEIDCQGLMNFIDRVEKDYVDQANSVFRIISKERSAKETLEEIQCFKKNILTFSEENQLLLNDKIQKSFRKEK